MARWPLAWAYQALKFDEWFYATHTGMDTAVYVRFLRACVYWVLLQTLTTAPILLTIHFKFSRGAPLSDMSSASLSYLVTKCNLDDPNADKITLCTHVPNEEGRKLLWIHLCLLWYITLTWFYALWWIAKGSIRTRRRWIAELAKKRQKAEGDAKMGRAVPLEGSEQDPNAVLSSSQGVGGISRGDDSDGWRQRTLLITNLPPTMRDEASVRRYFEEFLRPDDSTPMSSTDDLHSRSASESLPASDNKAKTGYGDGSSPQERPSSIIIKPSESTDTTAAGRSWDDGNEAQGKMEGPKGPEPDVRPNRHLRSPVQTIVLVRKMNELSAMLNRRQEVLSQLEAAHIKLAQSVLQKVGRQTQKMRKENKKKGGDMGGVGMGKVRNGGLLSAIKTKRTAKQDSKEADVEKDAAVQLREDVLRLNDLTYRLARFAPGNKGHHMREAQWKGDKEEAKEGNIMAETVWEALADVPRDLLDPYQPVTRLSSLFRGQKVPTIDYLLTKLNLLTALVTEMRARPPTSYEATSTAFVTFRDPRQARMVWRELKSQIVVKVRLAPEVKDLDWERLMRTSFTGDIVRGFSVNAFFWAFTILWVIPVGLLSTSLFSVDKLEGLFPTVQNFFKNNPNFQGFISNTLPSLIVSILTMCVPELIFQISKRAQGFVTFSSLYDQCLCRYWKFVICNVVIFFCVGATTVQSIIFQIGKDNTVLNSIAFAFPTAAPFYISYLILGMGLHTGFELLGFMVPLIQHLGARKAPTPRSRALKTLPRNFNRYYWLPFHVLILSIIFLFALLNPLVIPFALVYLTVALIVFKKNFAYTYFRRFNEKEGVIYFIRILRFSLDGLLVGQIVILIFFSVTKQVAVYIGLTSVLLPLNICVKLLGTRLWKSQCRALEDEEANALCGIGLSEALTPSSNKRDYFGRNSRYGHSNDDENVDYTSPLDARASGRYPPVVTAPQTNSKVLLIWNHIHDRFNANGNDRPSYVVSAQARGSHLSAKIVTNAVASAPKAVAQSAAHKSRHFGFAAKTHGTALGNGGDIPEGLPTNPSNVNMPPTSAKAYKNSLEQTQEAARKKTGMAYKQKLKRGPSNRSNRSDEAPFLSGFDAITSHAPVASECGDQEDDNHGDGEFERMLSISRRAARDSMRSQRNRRSASYSTAIIKGRPTDIGDESHLSTPQEGDEPGVEKLPNDEDQGNNNDEGEEEEEEEEEDIEGRALVKPHAKVTWDDTPNNSARYNNPFYSVELDPFLWLPRDPMKPIDLCDTIEWRGAALVSSQGGAGKVGEWDDDQGEDDEDDENHEGDDEDGEGNGSPLHGGEQIEIVGPLAQRLQEAEDAEHSVDPAASIPRNLMEDYKKAIGDDDESYDTSSPLRRRTPSTTGLGRSTSMMSGRYSRHSAGSEMQKWRDNSNQSKQQHLQVQGLGETLTVGKQGATTDEAASVTSGPGSPTKNMMVESPSGVSFASPSQSPQAAAAIPSTMMSRVGKAREPSHATSQRTADSAYEQAEHGGGAGHANRTVSMRRALKAEVLEEEYRRTIKVKLSEKKKREKQEAAALASTEGARPTGDEMELHDLEAQEESVGNEDGMDTIMARHEKRMLQRRKTASISRREANMSGMSVSSMRQTMSSAFMPRKSDGKDHKSSMEQQQNQPSLAEMGVRVNDQQHDTQ